MNMKLSNISLAVLVALGLVACGGSDSKDDAAKDPSAGQLPPPQPTNPEPPKPAEPTDGKDVVKKPTNEAVKGKEGRFHNDVQVATTVYANRKGFDTLAGYWANPPANASGSPNAGKVFSSFNWEQMVYEAGGTSLEDLKRPSDKNIVNYLQAGWINSNSANSADGKQEANVIRLNPLQTYAKVGDDFVRIVKVKDNTWDNAKVTDTFISYDNKEYPASALYYIPNVMTNNQQSEYLDGGVKKNDGAVGIVGYARGNMALLGARDAKEDVDAALPENLGTYKLDRTAAKTPGVNKTNLRRMYFDKPNYNNDQTDLSRQDIAYDYLLFGADDEGKGGDKYWFNRQNGANNIYKINLGEVPKGQMVTKNLDLGYSIRDNKGTNDGRDDDVLNKATHAGELRIYDVNYSRAMLEVNQAARENASSYAANPRNGLGFEGNMVRNRVNNGYGTVVGQGRDGAYGPFQVTGSVTGTIPLNGRAHYYGKSFGVNSIGNIDLEADFGIDRATVHGVIENRTTYGKKGTPGSVALPDMQLGTIVLSQPGQYRRDASVGLDSTSPVQNGTVSLGGQQNWGTWAVRFYGPNAASAAGVIAKGTQPNGGAVATNERLGWSNANWPRDRNNNLISDPQLLDNVVEVFNAERGELLPQSLNNPYELK